MIKKIQLINAPLSPLYVKSSRAGAYPPINLLSLATYLIKNQIKGDIEILDGELLSSDEIGNRINADIVGISANMLTHSTAIEIASAAKEKGAEVILGGHFPSALPRNILKNREFIDAVIIGDGEEAFLKVVAGGKYESIQNLAYRKSGDVIINPTEMLLLDKIPPIRFDLVNIEPYYKNFRNIYSYKPFSRPFAIYSSKGCLWRSKTGGCVFCGIHDKYWRTKTTKHVWDEIEQLTNTYNADFFWDVADTITEKREWLMKFAQDKPQNINPGFHLYGRINHIDSEIAELLSRINCYELFIGVESGDNNILKKSNKGFKSEEVLKAVEILTKFKINIVLSFLFGLPGENEKSIEKTVGLVRSILKITPIQEAFINIVLPLPGSKIFKMILSDPKLGPKYKDLDLFPLEELRKDWIEAFTNLTYKQAQVYRDVLLSLFPTGSSFGKPITN